MGANQQQENRLGQRMSFTAPLKQVTVQSGRLLQNGNQNKVR